MDIPYVAKIKASIVATGAAEGNALRAALEYFGYRVDLVLIGSRAEFMKILSGKTDTEKLLVFAVHGVAEGIHMQDESPVTPEDIAEHAKLDGKTVLNLGCDTGRETYRKAFKKAGTEYYVAPDGYPHGNGSLLFAIRFFYELYLGKSAPESVRLASPSDKETAMFRL